MKAFYLSLRYWAATIFIVTLFVAIHGLLILSAGAVLASTLILFMGAVITFPLILPCMWLLRTAARIPYSAAGKSWWLAFMLSLMYKVFLLLFRLMTPGIIADSDNDVFLVSSTAAIIIITLLSKNDLRNYYKEKSNEPLYPSL